MNIAEVISFDKEGRVEKYPLFRRLFLSVTIILVALLSFGLGRLSVGGGNEPIRVEYDPELSTLSQPANPLQGIKSVESGSTVVGSSKGNKYHYLSCPGAKQISEANKITFASKEAAEAAGYTLAANCKPN